MSNANHLTGAQIKALYESRPDTNAYTDAEKAKLGLLQTEVTVDWDDVTNKPVFGSASEADTSDFATAAQGALAQTALQPSALIDYESSENLDIRDAANRNRANHTGTQPISSITDLSSTLLDLDNSISALSTEVQGKEPADGTLLKESDIGVTVMAHNPDVVIDANYVHTQENYTTEEKQKLAAINLSELGDPEINVAWVDIQGKPAFGTAALADITDFATAEQGALADTAVQPSDITALATALQPSDIANFETSTQLNARDVANRGRSNHTGSQAISTITGLSDALNGKQGASNLLTNITYLTNTVGLLRKNGVDGWVLDTSSYLTAHPDISPSASNSSNTGISYIQSLTFDSNGHVITVNATSIPTATTISVGVVQLNNTVGSTSATQAATANAVKTAYDLAAATNTTLSSKANLASPNFTGSPTAPTNTAGSSTSVIANCEYVVNTIALPYNRSVNTVGTSTVQTTTGNYFTKTVSGNTTFTFSAPGTGSNAYSFTLEIYHTGGTITWPASVRWPEGTAPTLSTSKTHLFTFVTRDNGSKWYGSASPNYTP